MKNIHYIVGPDRRCLCGIYDGDVINCTQIRGDLYYIQEELKIKQSSNFYIQLAFSRIQKVFKSLEEDCQ